MERITKAAERDVDNKIIKEEIDGKKNKENIKEQTYD